MMEKRLTKHKQESFYTTQKFKSDLVKINMWGKRILGELKNKDDLWFENQSRHVIVPESDNVDSFLKLFARCANKGKDISFELVGHEDADEWGWINLTNSFLPFCLRFTKDSSSGTKIFLFFTFKSQLSKDNYDFDEAITDRIYWLKDKGVI